MNDIRRNFDRLGAGLLIFIFMTGLTPISDNLDSRPSVFEFTQLSQAGDQVTSQSRLNFEPRISIDRSKFEPHQSDGEFDFYADHEKLKAKVENFDLEAYYTKHNRSRAVLNYSTIENGSAGLVPTVPLILIGNSALESAGFSGLGTIDDPYLIEGLEFDLNASTHGILLQETDKFVNIVNNNFVLNATQADVHGIFLNNSANVIIHNNTLVDLNGRVDVGIRFQNSSNFSLSNNSITESIVFAESNNFDVLGNVVFDCDCVNAIFLERSTDFSISHNTVNNAQAGITVEDFVDVQNNPMVYSSRFSIFENNISQTMSFAGIRIFGAADFHVFKNDFHFASESEIFYALDVQFTEDFSVIKNQVEEQINSTEGFIILNSKNGLIGHNLLEGKHNVARRFQTTFRVGGENLTIFDNLIQNNFAIDTFITDPPGGDDDASLLVALLQDSLIFHNTIQGNLYQGIAIFDSSKITLEENIIISNSRNGIFTHDPLALQGGGLPLDTQGVKPPDHLIIKNNIIKDTVDGIDLTSTEFVKIEGNRIEKTSRTAIRTFDSNSIDIMRNKMEGDDEIFSGDGILIAKGEDIQIIQNEITEIKGDAISTSDLIELTIFNNTISNNDGSGVYVQDSPFGGVKDQTKVSIIENSIFDNGIGITILEQNNFRINGNTILNNKLYGLNIIQLNDPRSISINNNTISDHFSQGAIGLTIELPGSNSELKTSIVNNVFEQNANGVLIKGSGIYFNDNIIASKIIDSTKMRVGLELRGGSSNNVFTFNTFNNSEFAHIWIQSDADNPDLISTNNLIAWNNFYSYDMVHAFDQQGFNSFVYNYYEVLDVGMNASNSYFGNTTVQTFNSPDTDIQSADPLPLSAPVDVNLLMEASHLPSPFVIGAREEIQINRETGGDVINVMWDQYIPSDLFVYGNRSDFSYSLSYSNSGSMTNITSDLHEAHYEWNIGGVKDGVYDLLIVTTDQHTGRTAQAVVTFNIGPVSDEAPFFERNIIPISVVSVLLISGLVYIVTTYRYNLKIKQSYDSAGQARSYLDFIRKMKPDE